MTYREALRFGERKLENAGIGDAATDAWLLFSAVCRLSRTDYYAHMDEDVEEERLREYEALLERRAERVPLQYITGEQEFMGLSFRVNPDVLIPRQDTETLVEEALKYVRPGMKVMDMCTGSGCILISILKKVDGALGYGYDISGDALAVAGENAKRNGVSAFFSQSDLFSQVKETFDVIVSNPPYIPTAQIPALMPEVALFEPALALDGKEDGLYFYRRMSAESAGFLKPGGMILFEIGYDQGEQVSKLLRMAGYRRVRVIQDLARRDRVVVGER